MEAMEAVIGIRKELTKVNGINWEQRRYEIARDFYIQTCQWTKVGYDDSILDMFKAAASKSVVAADCLIEVLKK